MSSFSSTLLNEKFQSTTLNARKRTRSFRLLLDLFQQSTAERSFVYVLTIGELFLAWGFERTRRLGLSGSYEFNIFPQRR